MAGYRYRNDHDTPRSIPDAGVESVDPGAEFDSPVELHNALLTPVDPPGLAWNKETFRWEKPVSAGKGKAKAEAQSE